MPTLHHDQALWTIDFGSDENRFSPDFLDHVDAFLDDLLAVPGHGEDVPPYFEREGVPRAGRDLASPALELGSTAAHHPVEVDVVLERVRPSDVVVVEALRDRALTEDTERTRAQTVDGAPAIGSTVSERSASRLSVAPSAALEAKMPNEPEPIGLNRRQRRALAALERRSSRIAA